MVEDLRVEINPTPPENHTLDMELLHHMIRVAAKRDFSEMFCDAMRRWVGLQSHSMTKQKQNYF